MLMVDGSQGWWYLRRTGCLPPSLPLSISLSTKVPAGSCQWQLGWSGQCWVADCACDWRPLRLMGAAGSGVIGSRRLSLSELLKSLSAAGASHSYRICFHWMSLILYLIEDQSALLIALSNAQTPGSSRANPSLCNIIGRYRC